MTQTTALVRAAALVIVAVAAWLSLTPNPPSGPEGVELSDLVVHFLMHLGVASSLLLGWTRRRTLWIVLGLAVGLEVAQLAIPGRLFDLRDLAANLVGAGVGAGLVLLLTGRRARA